MSKTAYQQLEDHFHRLHHLGGARSILHWDAAVMMPEAAASTRAEQLAALQEVIHAKMVHPSIGEWLAKAEAESDRLDDWQKANVKEMRRAYLQQTALDADVVRELALAASESEVRWRQAKKEGDYASFLPFFERVIKAVRLEAQAKAEKLALSPYNALLDGYEPDARAEEIIPLFDALKAFLPDFCAEVMERQKSRKRIALQGTFAVEAQRTLVQGFLRKFGFAGRLDVSDHPFCGGVAGDVRITTKYDEQDPFTSFLSVMHELGHALYEQNLPPKWQSQPVGYARGMATHESQSLWVEMQLCRSRPFLRFAAPLMQQAFGMEGDAALTAENLYHLATEVKPDYIRIDADEVTYPSHVILRFELEKDIIEGKLEARHLPEAWNEKMRGYLGLVPRHAGEGCLQDIHWPSGAFGYFPTYSLGAMMAAQWMGQMRKSITDVDGVWARGEFMQAIDWLKTHVHSRASSVSRNRLLQDATGQPLQVGDYLNHLQERYLKDER